MEHRNLISTDFVSTHQAAKMLGLSMGTIQHMMDRGVVEGWKTSGGHRRLSVASLQKFRKVAGLTPFTSSSSKLATVMTESETLRRKWPKCGAGHSCPFEISWQSSLEAALSEMVRLKPQILIAEVNRPADVLSSLLGMLNAVQSPERETSIVLVSRFAKDVQVVNQDILLVEGPLTTRWLEVFFAGAQVSKNAILGEKC